MTGQSPTMSGLSALHSLNEKLEDSKNDSKKDRVNSREEIEEVIRKDSESLSVIYFINIQLC